MSWKEELVEKINALKPEDFHGGKAEIKVSTRVEDWRTFLPALHRTNKHLVAWIPPGYLILADFGTAQRFAKEHYSGDFTELYLVFEVMRDRKHNPVVLSSDAKTWAEVSVCGSVDFLSL